MPSSLSLSVAPIIVLLCLALWIAFGFVMPVGGGTIHLLLAVAVLLLVWWWALTR